MPKESLDSIQKQAEKHRRSAITCRISVEGLVTALCEEEANEGGDYDSAAAAADDDNDNPNRQGLLYAEHLRIRRGRGTGGNPDPNPNPNPNNYNSNNNNGAVGGGGVHDQGVWFASAATAYGTSSQTVLWSYRIPDAVLGFARRETVPCGVLVLLGFVDEAQTPAWASAGAGAGERAARDEQFERFVRRSREQQLAVAAEARMAPAERQAAASLRTQKEMQQRLQDSEFFF